MCMRDRKLRQRGGVSLHRRAPEKSKVYLDIVVVRKVYLGNSSDAMQGKFKIHTHHFDD